MPDPCYVCGDCPAFYQSSWPFQHDATFVLCSLCAVDFRLGFAAMIASLRDKAADRIRAEAAAKSLGQFMRPRGAL